MLPTLPTTPGLPTLPTVPLLPTLPTTPGLPTLATVPRLPTLAPRPTSTPSGIGVAVLDERWGDQAGQEVGHGGLKPGDVAVRPGNEHRALQAADDRSGDLLG